LLLQATARGSLSYILVLDLRRLIEAFAVRHLLVEVGSLVRCSLEALGGSRWNWLVLEAASRCAWTHDLAGVWHVVGALGGAGVRGVHHANSRRRLQLLDWLPVCLVLLLLVGGSNLVLDLVLDLVLLVDVRA